MATECTQEAVLEFLIEKGGRVKNKELIDHFKVFFSSEQTKRTLFKETFKRFVDNIAYVKQENGEKIVCLKKKYRHPEVRVEPSEDGECNGNVFPPSDTSTSAHSKHVTANHEKIRNQTVDADISSKTMLTGNGVNKSTFYFSQGVSSAGKDKHLDCDANCYSKQNPHTKNIQSVSNQEKMGNSEHMTDITLADNVLEPNGNLSEECSSAVEIDQEYTNVCAKEINASEAEHDQMEDIKCPCSAQSTEKSDSRASEVEAEFPVGKCAQIINRRRTSRGSQRSLLVTSEDGISDGHLESVSGEGNTPKCSRKNFIELMMSSSQQLRWNMVHRNSPGRLSFRGRDSVRSDSDSTSFLSSVDEDCALVTLDPLEHEWMMCTSDGQWESLQRLLAREPSLVTKRDFVTGFTSLHWAAKQGKHELLALLVGFAKQSGVPVNVNTRSSAGYTPLHLAAMHNHIEVMKLLVGAYDADVELRDYSGKKACQYLNNSVTGDIRDIIGATGDSDNESMESGVGRWRLPKVLPSNLNPLRLLNHAEEGTCDSGVMTKPKSLYRKSSIGRMKPRLPKARFKTQIVHSTSFRETEEGDGSLKSPVKTRPVSNLFG